MKPPPASELADTGSPVIRSGPLADLGRRLGGALLARGWRGARENARVAAGPRPALAHRRGAELGPGARASGRMRRAFVVEELQGLAYAFWARVFALSAVAAWLLFTVPAPRSFYYVSIAGLFFLLGLIPHLYRLHRRVWLIKSASIAFDVALLVLVIVTPPLFTSTDALWPQQMRLRSEDYLYLLAYLAGTALSFSPRFVLWAGACVGAFWTAGTFYVAGLPESFTNLADEAARRGLAWSPATSLALALDPHYVSMNALLNQLVLTSIIAGLLALTVWRARRSMVRTVAAETARTHLARYVSPDVADRLIAGASDNAGLARAATRDVAVLFVDIVGFTEMSEKLAPERVVALLRSFHARALRIVFAHRGTLDKFLGDGLMATFGTLAPDPNAARDALDCAVELVAEIERWSAKRVARGAPPIHIAVGVHLGPCVVGDVGAGRRLEFTVVGDSVNVASRLERLTREMGASVLASHALVDAAGREHAEASGLRPHAPLELRGRSGVVKAWALPRAAPPPPGPDLPDEPDIVPEAAVTLGPAPAPGVAR